MGLICSQVTLTWYPGDPGDTDSPLVLLSNADYLEEGAMPAALMRQLVQEVDYVRADSGAAFARGNQRTVLSWETYREQTDPMTQMETALATAAGLPTVVGWVRIQLEGKSAEWQIPDVVLGEAGGRPMDKRGLVALPWSISGGRLAIYSAGASPPTIYEPGEILQTGPAPTDRGAVLLTVKD